MAAALAGVELCFSADKLCESEVACCVPSGAETQKASANNAECCVELRFEEPPVVSVGKQDVSPKQSFSAKELLPAFPLCSALPKVAPAAPFYSIAWKEVAHRPLGTVLRAHLQVQLI